MKIKYSYLPFILFCITALSYNAQSQSQSAAVLSVYTQSAKIVLNG